MKNNRWLLISIIIVSILLIPFIAMQFTNEVNWTLTDFLVMGVVLFGIAFAYETMAKQSTNKHYRYGFAMALLGAFLLFWVNAAVGIIGNEGQSANLLYGAVFIVGLAGAFISRFKPSGMSLTLFAAALTQMLVPVVAFFIWPPPETSWAPNVLAVFIISGFFAALFIISGLLFRRSIIELKLETDI